MYRAYLCAALDKKGASSFASFISGLYGTDKQAELKELKQTSYESDNGPVFFFELKVSEKQWEEVHKTFLVNGWPNSAWMALDYHTMNMAHAMHVNDCSPGSPYDWDKFVDFATRRLGVREK